MMYDNKAINLKKRLPQTTRGISPLPRFSNISQERSRANSRRNQETSLVREQKLRRVTFNRKSQVERINSLNFNSRADNFQSMYTEGMESMHTNENLMPSSSFDQDG